MATINTSKVEGFRKLSFSSIDDALAEIDRVVDEARSDRLETLGNWSLGQILSHLAAWIEYGYDGYPMGKPPWLVRFILGLVAKRYLKNGMPRGIRIPGASEGTFGAENVPYEQAAERLKKALLRLKSGERCAHDSPAFGPMTHQERIQLNLRHAEVHLGYLRY